MASTNSTGDDIKYWFNNEAPGEMSLAEFQAFFPPKYRQHAQVKDLWMDYRAHHEHVMNVIGNEIDEEMNEREADKASTTHELDDLDTALANLTQAEHELDELNNKVHQDIQNCEVMIAMTRHDVSNLPDLESNGVLQNELAAMSQNLKELQLLCDRQ